MFAAVWEDVGTVDAMLDDRLTIENFIESRPVLAKDLDTVISKVCDELCFEYNNLYGDENDFIMKREHLKVDRVSLKTDLGPTQFTIKAATEISNHFEEQELIAMFNVWEIEP